MYGYQLKLTSIHMVDYTKYYVYLLIDPETNQIRYIGKGSKNRAWRFNRRNGHCESWIKSLTNKNKKPRVYLIRSNLSEYDAFRIEKLLIRACKKLGFNLTNLTDGGDGVSGLVMSKETRNKIRHTFFKKYQIPWNKGKRASKKLRKALSRGRKLGKVPQISEEQRLLRISNLKNHTKSKRKSVIGRHMFLDLTVRFESISAVKNAGFLPSQVSKCCSNEYKKHTHKYYYWRYDDNN